MARSKFAAGSSLVVAAMAVALLSGCTAFQAAMALRQVEFSLDGVSGVEVAGISLDRLQAYEDLTVLDATRLLTAFREGSVPVALTLEVGAVNPDANPEARLAGLDWTLFINDRETVAGGLADPLTIPSGAQVRVPVEARLDLMDFFQGGARDLAELALGLAGHGDRTTRVVLEARPTVETRMGSIRYPRPLTLVHREVGPRSEVGPGPAAESGPAVRPVP